MAAQPSLLDDLGEEVTGIMAPVSLCMAVTVLLVRLLNPEGVSSANSVLIASIAYQEQSSDSSGRKLGGALLNAIIFIGVIAGMTIILFLLFKYKCYKFIYAYMGFAVFNIFFFITGALFIQVMQVINLHIDAFSLAYGLYNFSIVGTLGLLILPIPLLSKQLYLIWVGIIVAYIFTFIPEWTAWVLLVFMALYDIAAVLIPGGPLKALVELAIERKQELPALIYEARPAGGRPYVRGWGNRGGRAADSEELNDSPGGNPNPPPSSSAPRPVAEGSTAAPASVEMRRPTSRQSRGSSATAVNVVPAGADARALGAGGVGARRPVSGGWTSGPSQAFLMEPAALPVAGEVEGGVQTWTGPTEDEANGRHNQVADWQQQQPRRLGAGPGGSRGPRPVGEGKEDDEWEPLPSSMQVQSADSDNLRGRLTRVLSSRGNDSARTAPRSNTSQEPLIEPGTEESGTLRNRDAVARGTSGGLSPGSRAGAGPSNPAVTSQRLQAMPSTGDKGCAAAFEGVSSQYPDNMGVRAVAPAIGADQIADAVRRRTVSGGSAAIAGPPPPTAPNNAERRPDSDSDMGDLPDAIKLGLGDFIFYSMLVGRAAMYDFMTVFSSYLAIIAGLGLTLLCLAVFQKALPALPFSIALGVAFYFLTRLTLEPFIVPMVVNLSYF